MVFGLQWGAWEGSSRKLARPTAWTAPAAHTFSLPLSKGDGRFLARVPTTRRIRTRYSSLRCFSQKASVIVVIAENFSARAPGILSSEDMMTAGEWMPIVTDQPAGANCPTIRRDLRLIVGN